MRMQTLAVPAAAYSGLMPPGFIDGGIAIERADYGSLWWAMIALEQSIEAARLAGDSAHAAEWQKLLSEFTHSFEAAARRDLRSDRNGNVYLPISVADTSSSVPQRGLYAFLFPVAHGRFFSERTPLVDSILRGNLGMLDACEREGLIASSGWMEGGVWPWLGGIHGIAHLIAGRPERAVDLLYAFANHAAPTGIWVEEQQTKNDGTRTSGDVSDAEASAVFVNLVRDLIAIEHADTLELLTGIPQQWVRPNARVALNGGQTLFGKITLELRISPDGMSASLAVSPVGRPGSRGYPRVHLDALKQRGFTSPNGSPLPDVVRGAWGKRIGLSFRRSQ
jgi:hypothetical protein